MFHINRRTIMHNQRNYMAGKHVQYYCRIFINNELDDLQVEQKWGMKAKTILLGNTRVEQGKAFLQITLQVMKKTHHVFVKERSDETDNILNACYLRVMKTANRQTRLPATTRGYSRHMALTWDQSRFCHTLHGCGEMVKS